METTKQFLWTMLVLATGLICMTQRAFAGEVPEQWMASASSHAVELLPIETTWSSRHNR